MYVRIRMKIGNVKLTLSVNKKTLDRYKKYCERQGFIISKQVEKFMEKTFER
jgi:hypothetical protein